jgi:predicted nucleic acid-binding protein
VIIADSSPLIALTQIGLIDLLETLFSTVLIPPAVARETARSVAMYPWLRQQPLGVALDSRIIEARLGAGESEALGLALEIAGTTVILDDLDARRLAQRLGISTIGTLGVLLAAREQEVIPLLRPHLTALLDARFFMSDRLIEELLMEVGEL